MHLFKSQLFTISVAISLLASCHRNNPKPANSSTSENKEIVPPKTESHIIKHPKMHDPPLVVSLDPDPQRAVIHDRLVREFTAIEPSDPQYAVRVTHLWSESCSQFPNQELPSAQSDSVANGKILPQELLIRKRTGIATDYPSAMLDTLAYMAIDRNGLLPELAKQRSNELPPSSVDLAIFNAIDSAINELDPQRSPSPLQPWEQLASAKNPVYRLLALRAALVTASPAVADLSPDDPNYIFMDSSAKLSFYQSFLADSDPLILTEALDFLATVPTPEAQQAIQKFQATQQGGNEVLIKVAADALRRQALLSQSIHR